MTPRRKGVSKLPIFSVTKQDIQELQLAADLHATRLKEAKEALQEKRRLEIQRQQDDLHHHLTRIDDEVEENRKRRIALRSDLVQKKVDRHDKIRENKLFHAEAWTLEMEHQLEDAARRRYVLVVVF